MYINGRSSREGGDLLYFWIQVFSEQVRTSGIEVSIIGNGTHPPSFYRGVSKGGETDLSGLEVFDTYIMERSVFPETSTLMQFLEPISLIGSTGPRPIRVTLVFRWILVFSL